MSLCGLDIGEIEDSEYAMIFLRDITESKAETARRMQMASDVGTALLLVMLAALMVVSRNLARGNK